MAGEEAERVAAVHHQRLLVGHLAQVLHHQAVLRPVLEHRTVAAVGDQLVRVLRHGRVQVVLDHQHDGRCLLTLRGVVIDGPRVHRMLRTQAIHVDAAVLPQLLRELGRQRGVVLRVEVAQGVAQGELLLLGREDVLALGRVAYGRIEGAGGGEHLGDAFADGLLEEGEVGLCQGGHADGAAPKLRGFGFLAQHQEGREVQRGHWLGGCRPHPTFPLPVFSWKP